MGNSDSKAAGGGDDTGSTAVLSTDDHHKDENTAPDRKSRRANKNKKGSDSKKRSGRHKKDNNNNNNNSDPAVLVSSQSSSSPPVMVSKNIVTDEQVHVNLAMADLMAYLQVVANNSNHLPLTRRDDPEVEKVIFALSSEEFAKKSAAFIPADIRVIGGTFTRYGAVWDLPTSEEYNACDGALEPGRSYGGACCNTLLKVLYDAANDSAAQAEAVSEAIFNDDEDDEEEHSTFTMGRSIKSGFSLEYGTLNTCTITWADLLRQMKAEFKEIGYAQVPKLTTSRKIDLNQPFSLFSGDSNQQKGKKRSLLIGCNYVNMGDAELKASYDDIRSMKDYIVNVHNFPEKPDMMTVLLDDGEHKPPTFLNIIDAFKSLSEQSQPGDTVFVQFSGHGGRVLAASNQESETESYDEVIVPCDYEISGLIRDTLIFKTLLAPMRFGVTLTLMVDCCDNGMVMELPYACSSAKLDKKEGFARLSPNLDFSFVRFLKVVRTLYETSTFTQLGRTVGSALGPLALGNMGDENGHDTLEEQQTNDDPLSPTSNEGSTFFDALVGACSPGRSPGRNRQTDLAKDSLTNGHEDEEKKMDELAASKESLFERVINCTLLSAGEDEQCFDDDTFNTRTFDEHSDDSDTYRDSFEDHSEDGYRESRRARHSRRRVSRSRRR